MRNTEGFFNDRDNYLIHDQPVAANMDNEGNHRRTTAKDRID